MLRNSLPSRKELSEYLEYNKQTGLVTYRKVRGGKLVGSEAGTTDSSGYKRICWKGKTYAMTRIIWMLETGEDPQDKVIDHIDKNKQNNKWINLRCVDSSVNNFHGNDKSNSTGYRGVTLLRSGRYHATIDKDKKRYALGTFSTAQEAHQAFLNKAAELYGQVSEEIA